MPVKVETCVMDTIQTLSLGINMEHYSFPRFREKDPFVTDFYNGVKGQTSSDSSADAGNKVWLPTPPLSPPHGNESLLPEMEVSDLDQLHEELSRLSKQQLDIDMTFFDEPVAKGLDRFGSSGGPPQGGSDAFPTLDSLFDDDDYRGHDPLQKMLIDPSVDRMWSGIDQGKRSSSWCPLEDEQQLFPDLPSSWTNHSISVLGSMTPSDSDSEEIDVVSTEDEKKQNSPFDPVYVSMLAKAKREASNHSHGTSSDSSWSSLAQSKKVHVVARVYSMSQCSAASSPTFHHNYSLSPDSATQEPKKVRPHQSSPEHSIWHDYAEKSSNSSATEPSKKGVHVRNSASQRCGSYSKATATPKSTLRHKGGKSQADRVSKHSRLVNRRNTCNNEYSGLKNDGERRQQHNVLERNRRNYMKSLYEDLRAKVPTLLHKEKTSKVGILDGSKTFIFHLQEEERKLESEKNRLRIHSRSLEQRILLLKSK